MMVQLPEAGRPFRTTLPVEVEQVGWVMVPTLGAEGAVGLVRAVFTPVVEVQVLAVICRLLYVPAGAVMEAARLDTETLVKLPEVYVMVYVPSGTLVNVRGIVPLLPQEEGLVTDPTVIVGVAGWALMATSAEAAEVQLEALVTVKL